MTVIVGVEARNGVVIAADSLASSYYTTHMVDTKLMRLKAGAREVLAGICGSFRFGQVLQYRTRFPACPRGVDADEFMATKVSDAIRDSMKKAGYARKKDEVEDISSAGALLGYRGRLYWVAGNFEVVRPSNGYWAEGAGSDLAVGAVAAQIMNEGPLSLTRAKAVAYRAVEAACLHSPWCELPVTVEVGKT